VTTYYRGYSGEAQWVRPSKRYVFIFNSALIPYLAIAFFHFAGSFSEDQKMKPTCDAARNFSILIHFFFGDSNPSAI
jgi:hypothetical protein